MGAVDKYIFKIWISSSNQTHYHYFRNLVKSQKLLSIGLEAPLPFHHNPIRSVPIETSDIGWSDQHALGLRGVDSKPPLPFFAFMGMIFVVCFTLYQYFRNRNKPKKRRTKIRRFLQVLSGNDKPRPV